jgi:hypothetical protein
VRLVADRKGAVGGLDYDLFGVPLEESAGHDVRPDFAGMVCDLSPHCVACNRDGTLIAAGERWVDSPDEQRGGLAEASGREFFHLYSADGQVVLALVGHANCMTCTAFSPADGSLLASSSSDRTIKI